MQAELKQAGIRAGIDERNEKLGYKIRESQVQKIPYVLVLGDQEEQEEAVNVCQFGYQQNEHVPFQTFKDKLVKQVENRGM
ncbi:Threonyl-tRNA synthetase [Bacillus subtilis subsp. subtilis]|uniref:Threonyl-tRNA synthetase n=1 Tax=Bacillus subtilis subsp. subtilis TaxID=135461 RepID=A0ABD3ZUQ3_BACIU|nr:Threonyl-tRNA synthetase [Bacillus subtilis subsp. subtilis]